MNILMKFETNLKMFILYVLYETVFTSAFFSFRFFLPLSYFLFRDFAALCISYDFENLIYQMN